MTKAIAAVIISIIQLFTLWTGSQLDVSEQWIETALMVISPILVWLIPNDWLWPTKGRSRYDRVDERE